MFRQDTLDEEDDGFVYCRKVDDMCVHTHVSSVLRLRKAFVLNKAYACCRGLFGTCGFLEKCACIGAVSGTMGAFTGCNWWRCTVIRAGSNFSFVGVWLSLSAMFASCCGRLRLLMCLLLYVCVAMY